METRLKERLTGAAILVALIVLVVPELFHGQHPDAASSTGSSGEGPPVRSYTIDLSNGSSRTAPLQSTERAGEPGVTPPVSPTPATPVAAVPTTTTGSVAPAASTIAPTPTPTPAPPPTATPRPKPAASPAPPAPNHAAAKAGGTGAWSVQLGLFASRENAERLMHSAQGKGFSVSVSEADGRGLYHVVAGGLADRAAAQTLQGRLQSQGFQAALVAPQSGTPKSQH